MPSNDSFQWATVDQSDLALWDRYLRKFVPPDAFDAHAHLFRLPDLGTPIPPLAAGGPAQVTRGVYERRISAWMPNRCPSGGLFFPLPTRGLDVAAANQFVADQVVDDPGSRGLMMVTPHCDFNQVREQIANGRFVGFKVYHLFAGDHDTHLLPPDRFIPEWIWELADQFGSLIMLHLVMPRALAEPANQRYLMERCGRFPNAKLILAHAARGFCSRHTIDGVHSLRGLDNVFFDSSAICEPSALEAILRTFGPTKLLFGTDFCVTEMRSRCVDLADGFLWLDEVEPDYRKSAYGQPTLLGLESLLALQQACRNQHLSDSDVEEVFCLAARRILGLPPVRSLRDVQQTYESAKQIIPGGTQLLSKRPEMFAPQRWPAYYREARGCEVIDIEGNHFIDMSLGGILACILGYSDPDVNAAVIRRVQLGSMSTLQTDDEVELARLLLQIHPWAGSARFTRGGGEAMAVAVRIARALTGRSKLALCGYHGWHDWYLAANLSHVGDDPLDGHLLPGLEPAGVPNQLSGSTLTFSYNNSEQFDALIKTHGHELAAVVMEPTRHHDPERGFLENIRQQCDQLKIPLVFDEISIGWRLCLGGAHRKYGVEPDLAVFAKALGNGFPIAAVIGKYDCMQAAQSSFISSTFWSEGVGPAAAVACLKKMMRQDVPAHLNRIGSQVIEGWRELGRKHGLPIQISGRPEMALLSFDHPESATLMTMMTSQMLDHGYLASSGFNAMLAHEPRHVADYLTVADDVFGQIKTAINSEKIKQHLLTPVKQTGFSRLT